MNKHYYNFYQFDPSFSIHAVDHDDNLDLTISLFKIHFMF